MKNGVMFGERLKELRINNSWTQQELGDRLGVSKQSVSNWENGNIMPSVDQLVKVSRLFRVSTDCILGIVPDMKLDISGLDSEQIMMIQRLLTYFRKMNSDLNTPGASNRL